MTRLAVLSDTHGNLPALEAVLADVEGEEVDGIIVAGDLVGGPHPVETINLLRALDAWMIQGNAENGHLRYAAGNAPDAWRVNLQFALLRWTHRQLDQETLDFFESLPEQRVVTIPGTTAIRVVHGSPRNPSESIFLDRDPEVLELALAQTNEPVLICGHTHIPWQLERDDRLIFNPGSVCGPLNGEVGAHYALLTWRWDRWAAEHRNISYDLSLVRAAFRDSGLLEQGGALARAFLLSIETARNVADDFLAYAWALTARAGLKNCAVIPDALWEEAAATFGWDAYSE